MKIVVFGPERRVGVLRGNQVVDLSLAYAKYLKERQSERQPTRLAAVMVPSDLARFIEGGQRTLELADAALDHLFGNVQDQLGPDGEALLRKASEVRLHAPRPDGSRIACAGGNFADHLAGMAAMGLLPGAGRMSIDEAAKKIRDNGIWGFWKVGRHTAASGEQLPYPSRADRLDYEGEVAIILNREVRDVRATELRIWSGGSPCWGIGASGARPSRQVR